MTDIIWGDPIEVNGVRPEWLADDVRHLFLDAENKWYGNLVDWVISEHDGDWSDVRAIRLPVGHPAYLALANGFVPWGGGDEAPADWDGGVVLMRNGSTKTDPAKWAHPWHGGESVDYYDVIGYRAKAERCECFDCNDGAYAEQPAPAIAPELVERALNVVRRVANGGDNGTWWKGEARAILSELEPADPDMGLAKSIAGDVEAIALAIKAARENG